MRSKDVYKFLSITKNVELQRKNHIVRKISHSSEEISILNNLKRKYIFIVIYKNGIFINNDRR